MRLGVFPGLSVFVPGKLQNPLNGSWGHWSKHARIARDWRERTAQHLFVAVRTLPVSIGTPETPKRVTFTAYLGRAWDDDALPGACKPIRDALADLRVVHHDGATSGHVFVYAQRVERGRGARRGVEIAVEVLA